MKARIAIRNPHTYIVLATDAALIFVAYWLAYWLRFETGAGEVNDFFWRTAPAVIALKLVVFAFYGLESGMWRYTSLVDLINLVKAVAVSFATIMVGLFFWYYSSAAGMVSRSVFIIDSINTLALVGLFRVSIRLYYSRGLGMKTLLNALRPSRAGKREGGMPAVIYGANERGELLLRGMTGGEWAGRYDLVGIIDDNQQFSGSSIHGYTVLGSMDNFEDIVTRLGVRELLVASQLSGEKLEEMNTACRAHNVTMRVIPAYLDGEHGKIDVSHLRNIQIEDLLNREPVSIDFSRVEGLLKGKRVLITGAGGSIGAQLARQIAEFGPSKLALVDVCENYLYHLGVNMNGFTGSMPISYHCADVADSARMDMVFAEERPQFVFHAAAHKHVPLMEMNKGEAVRNNVGGIVALSALAEKYGVERFVLISTDKAVDPSNAMGATKRMCELYIKSRSRNAKTIYMAVRFGNVLGSNGSVVPLFLKQIEDMGPVTVTHPDVERYFMTIPEAVLLILQTGAMGGQGGLFLLDMGEPVKIADLAKKMIRLAGFEPGRDIEIKYTGLRPGEKLQEFLNGDGETLGATAHPKIRTVVGGDEALDGVEELARWAVDNCLEDGEGVYHQILKRLKSPAQSLAGNMVELKAVRR
ncbi:MAG: polysaccharide biosynthesis protein [Nitrospinae bacterium]|nr:polysaccharide biosynthesis protein [Nitrospinota bacterium]